MASARRGSANAASFDRSLLLPARSTDSCLMTPKIIQLVVSRPHMNRVWPLSLRRERPRHRQSTDRRFSAPSLAPRHRTKNRHLSPPMYKDKIDGSPKCTEPAQPPRVLRTGHTEPSKRQVGYAASRPEGFMDCADHRCLPTLCQRHSPVPAGRPAGADSRRYA